MNVLTLEHNGERKDVLLTPTPFFVSYSYELCTGVKISMVVFWRKSFVKQQLIHPNVNKIKKRDRLNIYSLFILDLGDFTVQFCQRLKFLPVYSSTYNRGQLNRLPKNKVFCSLAQVKCPCKLWKGGTRYIKRFCHFSWFRTIDFFCHRNLFSWRVFCLNRF